MVSDADLDRLLAEYSCGSLLRTDLERATGLWFGEILTEMAKRGLALPKVDSRIHYNEAQMALFNNIFGKTESVVPVKIKSCMAKRVALWLRNKLFWKKD